MVKTLKCMNGSVLQKKDETNTVLQSFDYPMDV